MQITELIEDLLKVIRRPQRKDKKKIVLRAQEYLSVQKSLVTVDRVIRYTGTVERMEQQLKKSISKDNPREYSGMVIEEVSREVKE